MGASSSTNITPGHRITELLNIIKDENSTKEVKRSSLYEIYKLSNVQENRLY